MKDLVELAHEEVTFDDNFLFLKQLRGYGHPRLLHGTSAIPAPFESLDFWQRRCLVQNVLSPEVHSGGALHLLAAPQSEQCSQLG